MLNVLRFIFLPIGTYIFRLMVKRKGVIFLLITVQRKCKRAQSQACLNYAECSLSSNDSAKIRRFSVSTKFWHVIRSDFQQITI